MVIPIIGPRKSSTLTNGKSIAEIVEDFSDVGTDKSAAISETLKENAPTDSIEAMAARELLQGLVFYLTFSLMQQVSMFLLSNYVISLTLAEGLNIMKEDTAPTLEALPLADDKDELQREVRMKIWKCLYYTK